MEKLNKNSYIPFGKYKGQIVSVIKDINPAYLKWLHENTEIKLQENLYEEICELVEELLHYQNERFWNYC